MKINRFQDWEQRKLGSESKILTGGTPKTSIPEYWEPKKIPWMSSGEVNKRRLDGTDNMISEEGLNNSSARWVKKHSVLIALAGQGKTRGTVAVNNIQLTTNQSIAAIVPNDNLYYEFIYQNLIKRYDELRMISSGDGTRGGLNKQIVSDIVMPSPSRDEQYKIGTFFKQLDDTIALHQQKYDHLIQLKKAYLDLMFPKNGESVPKIRFADFQDNWEQRKLSDVIEKLSGGASIKPTDYLEDGIRTIPKGAVSATGIADLSGSKYISEDFFEKNITSHVHTNNLVTSLRDLVPSAPNMGRIVRIEGDDEQFLMPQGVYKLELFKGMDEDFLISFSNSDKYRKIISAEKNGSTQVHIRNGEFLNIDINLPSKHEQKKIGTFFKILDNTITLHQKKIASLKSLKQAYLQKMFV